MPKEELMIYLAIPESDLQFVVDSLDKVSGTRVIANSLEVALHRARFEHSKNEEEE